MSDNIVDFPKSEEPPEFLVGPFEEYRVVVQGRFVPRLTGYRSADGKVSLTVDRRFGAEFSTEEDARQAAWLIAQAASIFAGYSNFEADNKDQPFASRAMCISTVTREP